jgi:tetratricopeptide (TPR) repeat protein
MRFLRCFSLFCFTLAALPAHAQDWKGGSGRLEGKVVDADGKPIEGVAVKLELPGRGGTTLKTDKKGHWAILGLTDGNWNLDFQAPGFVMKKISAPVSEANRIPPIETKLEKAQAAGPPPEVTAALQEGDDQYKAGHYPEARAAYEKLLAMRPDLAKALQMQIARCFKMEKNIPAELEHLKAASDLSPGDADIKTLMAMEAVDAGLMDQAVELLKQVDESTIKSPDVFYNIGVSFLNKGKSDEAITYFTKAVTLDPNYVDGYFQRGLTYFGMQKTAESKADLQKVVTLAPQSPQAETAKKALASMK